MPKAKKKPVSKKKSAAYILAQIAASSVFGAKRKTENPNTGQRVDKVVPFRSDADKPKIPSSKARAVNTFATEKSQYSGEQDLSVGQGYNKSGFQVLMKTEIKDAGKKTSQLED